MAIQVNGTEVISNSRALNNIASVDATTATAIGAAGVGGSLEFISETNITADASYIDIAFSTGYRGFHIALNKWTRAAYNVGTKELWLYVKDSSGTILQGQDYIYKIYATTGEVQSSRVQIGVIGAAGPANGIPNDRGSSFFMTFMNPRVSDVQTNFNSWGGGYVNNNGDDKRLWDTHGLMTVPQDNVGIRLQMSQATIGAQSKSYTVWGIK